MLHAPPAVWGGDSTCHTCSTLVTAADESHTRMGDKVSINSRHEASYSSPSCKAHYIFSWPPHSSTLMLQIKAKLISSAAYSTHQSLSSYPSSYSTHAPSWNPSAHQSLQYYRRGRGGGGGGGQLTCRCHPLVSHCCAPPMTPSSLLSALALHGKHRTHVCTSCTKYGEFTVYSQAEQSTGISRFCGSSSALITMAITYSPFRVECMLQQ